MLPACERDTLWKELREATVADDEIISGRLTDELLYRILEYIMSLSVKKAPLLHFGYATRLLCTGL